MAQAQHIQTREAESSDNPIDWALSRGFLRLGIGIVGGGAAAYLGLLLVTGSDAIRIWQAVAYMFIAAAAWLFMGRGRAGPAVWVLGIGCWLHITVSGWLLGGVTSTVMVFYPPLILLAGWMFGARAAGVVTALSIGATFAMLIADATGRLPAPPPSIASARWLALAVVFVLNAVLVVYFVRSYRERMRDVRRLGETLARRATELQAILASTGDAIIAVDNRGTVIHANRQYTNLWNLPATGLERWSEAERLAHCSAQLVRPEAFVEHIHRLRASGGTHVDMLEFADGRSVARYTGPLIEDGVQVGRVWTLRDVTRQRRAEAEIERLNASLEARVRARTAELQQANQELESFSYTISHDLRAPLRSMAGFTGLLLENLGPTLDAENRGHLQRIAASSNKMSELIDGVLEYSRLARSDVRRGDVDLDLLVREVVAELAASYPHTAVVAGALGHAHADPVMTRQIFRNLIDNAFKYSARVAGPRIEVGVQAGGEYFVRDNGVGFDMAHAEHLFKLFTRLHSDPSVESTGAGLAIVKRLVDRHGGSIRAEATPGGGATFSFRLRPAGAA